VISPSGKIYKLELSFFKLSIANLSDLKVERGSERLIENAPILEKNLCLRICLSSINARAV